jgi:PQQ-like domain
MLCNLSFRARTAALTAPTTVAPMLLAVAALTILATVAPALAVGPPRPKLFDPPPKTTWKPQGCRTVPATNTAAGSRDQWRFLHADAAASDEVGIAMAPAFTPDWQAETATFNVAVPTFDHDGNLYFSPLWPYENVVLVSLDPSDGSRRWAITGTGAPSGGVAPIVLNDPDNPGEEIVYQTFYDRALAVKTDGTIVWDVPTGLTLTGIARQDAVLGNSYHQQLDAIVALAGDGHMYALDRASGAPLLTAPYSLPGEPSPAGAGLALPPDVVDAVAADLTQFLNFPPSASFESFLAVILGNGIEVANSFAIDASSGRLWVAATAPDGDDGTVDGVSELGALYGLDLVPSGLSYDVSIGCYATFVGGSASTPGLKADGSRIYIGDNSGNLIALDDTCAVAWTLPLSSQIVGSIAVASDNHELYASTQTDVVQVIDQGASATIGWTAALDVYDPGQTNQGNFNMLLAGIGANGVSFMAGAGLPPGTLANIGVPMTVGYGVLDRGTGAVRYFADGLDESVAELNVGPDGGYYNSNSPIRRAFTRALFPALTPPIEGGIRKFKPTHVDLLVRDIVCAAHDRAANADANAGTCPSSAAADAVQIDDLIAQARRVAPPALAGGEISQAKWARVDARLTAAAGAPLSTVASELDRACAVMAPCPSAPLTGCRTAAVSKLTLKRDPSKVPNADTLSWTWSQGQPTSTFELGDPTAGADYGLCVYSGPTGNESLVYEVGVPASTLWRLNGSGIGYADKSLAERGLKSLRAKASDQQKSSFKAKAKGAALPAGPFPLVAPVVVQAVNSESGLCWESSFANGDVSKRDATHYKAKTP